MSLLSIHSLSLMVVIVSLTFVLLGSVSGCQFGFGKESTGFVHWCFGPGFKFLEI